MVGFGKVKTSRVCKALSGNGPALLPELPLQAMGVDVAVPQNERISRAPSRPTPQTYADLARLTKRVSFD
jgi:hypothetical protein